MNINMNKPRAIIVIEHPLENAALRVLSALLLTLICSYLYFVGASVLNIIARKEALTEAAKLGTTISNSERDYFTIAESVTPESGASLGLAPVSAPAYVYRPSTVGQADTPHNEI